MTKQEIVDKLNLLKRFDISYNHRYGATERKYGSDYVDAYALDEIIEEIEKDIAHDIEIQNGINLKS